MVDYCGTDWECRGVFPGREAHSRESRSVCVCPPALLLSQWIDTYLPQSHWCLVPAFQEGVPALCTNQHLGRRFCFGSSRRNWGFGSYPSVRVWFVKWEI
jgi:hypothetical protein